MANEALGVAAWGAPVPGRLSSKGVMTDDCSANSAARTMTLRISRRLPGQGYAIRAASASGVNPVMWRCSSVLACAKK